MLKNETLCIDFPTELKMCGCAKEEDGRLLYSNVAEFLMDSSTATSLTAECANRFRIHWQEKSHLQTQYILFNNGNE